MNFSKRYVQIFLFLGLNALLVGSLQECMVLGTVDSPNINDDSFSFTITCDMRGYTNPEEFPAVLDAITATGGPGVFMLVPGDFDPPWNVDASIEEEFGAGFVWYPIMGNHELESSSYVDWVRNEFYNLPYIVNSGPTNSKNTTYSFDYGNAHFVVLNEYYDGNSDFGTNGDIVPALYTWLEADLAATNKKWIFVTGHEPAYPQPDADWGDSRHVGESLDKYPTNRDAFWTLLDSHDVTAYICGHTHRYSRYLKDGVWQVDAAQARGTGKYDTFLRVTVKNYQVTYETYRSLTGTFSLTDSFKLASAPIIVRGNNDRIYYNVRSCEGSRGSWNVVPIGTTCDSPAAAVYDGRLYMVVRGMDERSLWFGWVRLSDDSFHGWDWISGETGSAPTLVSRDGELVLVVRGLDNRVYYRLYDCVSDTWDDWVTVPVGSTSENPAAAVLEDNLHIAVLGLDGNMYHCWVNLGTSVFSGWTRLPGATPSTPELTFSAPELYLVVRGMDDVIYYNVWSSAWAGWTKVPRATTHARAHGPAATVFEDNLHLAVLGTDGNMYYGYLDLTDGWTPWARLSGATPSAPTLTS